MRGDFRGCRYFVMFRPPSLLAPQIVPTAANTPAGQPGLLRPSRTRFVTSPRIGYANRPTTGNWRYGDLHPARLRPCRLLLSSIPPNIRRVDEDVAILIPHRSGCADSMGRAARIIFIGADVNRTTEPPNATIMVLRAFGECS